MTNKKVSSSNNVETLRHSAAHILAVAVLDMFPETKLGVGPAIESEFFHSHVQIDEIDGAVAEEGQKNF